MTSPSTVDLDTARSHIERGLADLLAVPDAVLERSWPWPDHGEADVRYGFFRILEDLEATAAAIDAERGPRPLAEAIVAPVTVARWDLVGALLPLTGEELDTDPGDSEWTVRQAVAHIVSVQHAYAVYTGWWRAQGIRSRDALPAAAPEGLEDPAWDEATAADGIPDHIRRRLHQVVDEAGASVLDVRPDELDIGGRWSGLPVTVGFRYGRWSSHMSEHAVQVDKTLVWLGRQPSEVERLVRIAAGAWGRLESLIWPGQAAGEATMLAVEAAHRTAETAASVRAAGVVSD